MGLKWGSNSAAYSSSWFKTVHFTAPLKVLPPQRNGNGNGECLSHLSPWIMRQSWRGLRSQSEVDSVQIHQDEMQRHTCFGRQTLNSQNDGLENVWRHSGIYNVPGYVNFLECWSVRIFISVLPKKKKKTTLRLCWGSGKNLSKGSLKKTALCQVLSILGVTASGVLLQLQNGCKSDKHIL